MILLLIEGKVATPTVLQQRLIFVLWPEPNLWLTKIPNLWPKANLWLAGRTFG